MFKFRNKTEERFLFHKNVNENFVEFFLIDMCKNYESLIYLAGEHIDCSEVREREIEDYARTIFSIFDEEKEMLKQLMKFRTATHAEYKKLKEILRLKESDDVKYIISISNLMLLWNYFGVIIMSKTPTLGGIWCERERLNSVIKMKVHLLLLKLGRV